MTKKFDPVEVSAPSKIILHGEHAVVYGKTAVAASIGLRTRMILRPVCGTPEIKLHFPDVSIEESWTKEKVTDLLAKRPNRTAAVKRRRLSGDRTCDTDNDWWFPTDRIEADFLIEICQFLGVDKADLRFSSLTCFFYLYSMLRLEEDTFPPLDISIQSDIPIGQGLGSSSALSVCLATGLLAIRDQNSTPKPLDDQRRNEICQLSRVSEQILHGRCSGIDNAVSTYGGLIRFANFARVNWGGTGSNLVKSLGLRILLVGTKVPRNTKLLVDHVRKQTKEFPSIVQPVIDAIDSVSVECLATLDRMAASESDRASCYRRLATLIDYNQRLLATLGVSHPSLDRVCAVAASNGLHGKLTGAGGGGYAYVLLPPDVKAEDLNRTVAELEKENFDCWETELGVDGVIVKLSHLL